MIFGFDLDGTLDKPELAYLANHLLQSGHTVHVITSVFPESGNWQSRIAKLEKLQRLGVPTIQDENIHFMQGHAKLHVIYPENVGTIEERLRIIGLQKGILTEKMKIDVFFDDSSTFCDMIPRMDGHVTVLRVM
jgi:hypothetical protein